MSEGESRALPTDLRRRAPVSLTGKQLTVIAQAITKLEDLDIAVTQIECAGHRVFLMRQSDGWYEITGFEMLPQMRPAQPVTRGMVVGSDRSGKIVPDDRPFAERYAEGSAMTGPEGVDDRPLSKPLRGAGVEYEAQ